MCKHKVSKGISSPSPSFFVLPDRHLAATDRRIEQNHQRFVVLIRCDQWDDVQ